MNIFSLFYLIGFLIILSITFAKLWNVINGGRYYKINMGFMLFVGFMIAWLIVFISFANYPENIMYHILYRLSTGLMILNVVFLIIELILTIRDNATPTVKAYKPERVQLR